MTQPSKEKAILSGIGKFGTLSELLKRNLDANITIGNSNLTDITIDHAKFNFMVIQVTYPDGTKKNIKVKTSRTKRFVTNWQKYRDATEQPDYWVIVHIDRNEISHYYILTHAELGVIQAERNGCSQEEISSIGVDNVLLKHIDAHENRWDKIVERK